MNPILTLLTATTLLFVGSANAAYLYWTTTPVNAARTSTCLSFANSSLRALGYSGIRVTPGLEVSGSKSGAYLAVTCLSTSRRATAVVMGVGDDGDSVNRLQTELARRISQVVCIDTCE